MFNKWINTTFQNKETNEKITQRSYPPGGSQLWNIISGGKFNEGYETAGLFHCWGTSYEESDTNYGNYSIALVEDNEGFVHEVLPGNLKFIEGERQKDYMIVNLSSNQNGIVQIDEAKEYGLKAKEMPAN